MRTDTAWGSWSLNWDGSVLVHDGGYGIALADIDGDRDASWWMEHLRGKGWATPDVRVDFWCAARDMGLVA
jgi:hypothetical protein